MSAIEAELCRRNAEECLVRAELAPDEFTRARMKKLAREMATQGC